MVNEEYEKPFWLLFGGAGEIGASLLFIPFFALDHTCIAHVANGRRESFVLETTVPFSFAAM